MVTPLQAMKEHNDFLAEGRFMLLRDKDTGRFMYFPRIVAPENGSSNLEWVEASGNGTVYSMTTVGQRPPKPNYNVSLIDLQEGPRMMCRVDGIPAEDVAVDMPVKAKVIVEDDIPMVVFVPA